MSLARLAIVSARAQIELPEAEKIRHQPNDMRIYIYRTVKWNHQNPNEVGTNTLDTLEDSTRLDSTFT